MSDRGWILPDGEVVLLEEASDLVALDSVGRELARFSGPVAAALRGRLRGDAAPSPVLDTLLRVQPALERLLSERPLPLDPDGLLMRGSWGQLFVEVTAQCNERCRHCYASSSPERTESLDRATVEAVVREAAALEFDAIQFTGGDPLLCPFLGDVAHLAREEGIGVVEVFTNGVLLNERRYAELRAADAAFAFSLYARSADVHDAVTGLAGSHALTVAAIRRAVAGGSPARVGVIATRPEDEPEALAAVELAAELGIPPEQVRLEVSRSVGRGEYAGRPIPASSAGGGAHARSRKGKAAVLPDGWVTPCIFSRDLRLGRVGPEGGLRAALQQPAARLRDPCHASAAGEELLDACADLSCGECRLVSTFLRPREPRSLPQVTSLP